LNERLFLNPLNDLGPYTIAARDILVLPSYTTPIEEPPTLIGFYNQMKQEFVSARWFLYECMQSEEPHFSDRDVTLYNTLDYPSYGLPVERAKAAYRIAYSLFDKIAYFLNDYAKLGVRLNQVYFRTVWYTGQDARRGVIRDELVKMQNWPLRGLFWLAKDLFDPDLQDSAEPEAQELYVIRNCLEHSYLKVHEILPSRADTRDPFRDRLAHSVQREAFIKKTLLVLRRARGADLSLPWHAPGGEAEVRGKERRPYRTDASGPLGRRVEAIDQAKQVTAAISRLGPRRTAPCRAHHRAHHVFLVLIENSASRSACLYAGPARTRPAGARWVWAPGYRARFRRLWPHRRDRSAKGMSCRARRPVSARPSGRSPARPRDDDIADALNLVAHAEHASTKDGASVLVEH
jgi:hypothetical protein